MKGSAPYTTQQSTRLMLFDLALGGHHGNYIQYLVEYIYTMKFNGVIDIVILPQFLEMHEDTVAALSGDVSTIINWVPLSPTEASTLGNRNSGLKRALRNIREWQVFYQYAKVLKTTQALFMYLDTCELPITLGMRSPCPFSGIYFRPTFHYPALTQTTPSRQEKQQQLREIITLNRILQRSQTQTIFCLDPYAVEALQDHRHSAKVVHLADPVPTHQAHQVSTSTLRATLGIEHHRQVFLLFGALDGRKGIYQLLDAIALLSRELSSQLCLLLVGKASATEQNQIHHQAEVLIQQTEIQIIERYDFVPDSDVHQYFALSDIILAPYQRHVGMSGILLLAAAAGKAVLSSDYGLMGEVVRRYKLGLAIDSSQATAIAHGITRCLTESLETLCDLDQMQKFAAQNSVSHYASTIFKHLYPDFSQNQSLTEIP